MQLFSVSGKHWYSILIFVLFSFYVNGLNLFEISTFWHSGHLSPFDNKGCTVGCFFATSFALCYCSGSTECSGRFSFRFGPLSGTVVLLQDRAARLRPTGIFCSTEVILLRLQSLELDRDCVIVPWSAANDVSTLCMAEGFISVSYKWTF
jgi:hypothetical protein